MSTYWLLSLPVTDTPDATASALHAALVRPGLAAVTRFALPEGLRVGTLDGLLSLADDLARVNATVEGTVNKVRRALYDLAGGDGGVAATVDGAPAREYVERFRWDAAKYPPRTPLADTVAAIGDRVAKLDDELKVRGGEHAAARAALAAATRKQTGSLAVRDLWPLLAGRAAKGAPPLPSSDNLVTLGVVVPRGADREFQASYESFSDYVVPRSATVLAEDGDYLLYGVTLFRRTANAFRTAARGRGFQVRDIDTAHANGSSSSDAAATATDGGVATLRADVDAKRAAMEAWAGAAYGDALAAWIHICAVRLFVESVLRYGVPPRLVAALVAPAPRAAAKARAALAGLVGPGAGGRHFDGGAGGGGDEAGGGEMYPYVSFTLAVDE